MNCKRPAILLACVLSLWAFVGAALAATWEGVYTGTLGKAKVLVELRLDPEHTAYKSDGREVSRYSYMPKARDIHLMLESEGKSLRFAETGLMAYEYAEAKGDDRKITGYWDVTLGPKGLVGSWTSPDGKKKLPIMLKSFYVDTNSGDALGAIYDREWLKTVSFKDSGSFKTFGNIEVRKLKDSAFGIEFPIFAKFPDKGRMKDINATLERDYRREVAMYRACKNDVSASMSAEPSADGPEISYDVTFANAHVLSFNQSGSLFCGGAHPNNFVTPITYDLDSKTLLGGHSEGSDLDAVAFGRVMKLTNKDERIAFERFAIGRWLAEAGKDKEMGEDCKMGWIDESPDGEKNFSLSFTDKGLAITRTDYPHVASVCLFQDFNPTVVSWDDLKPWLKPGQTLLP
jgi:hypothetical protein